MMKNVHVGWGPVGLTRIVPNPTQITLKDPGILEVGSTTTLKYTANIQGDISWQSSNSNVATIDKNGQLTAVGSGTVTITLTITKDGKEYKDTKKITVKLPYSEELKNEFANCNQPGNIKLEKNVVASLDYSCGNKVTLNLNGMTLTGDKLDTNGNVTTNAEEFSDSYGIWVKKGKVTITGDGVIEAQECKYSMAVWADGGTVNIESGTFINHGDSCDLIYASNGSTVNISGGYFEACGPASGTAQGTKNPYSALNIKDAHRKNTSIIVTGGIFKNFNPANNLSEGPNTNFVNNDKYVVVKAEKTNNGWQSTNEVLTQAYSGGEDIYYMVIAKSETPEQPPVEEPSTEPTIYNVVNVPSSWNGSDALTYNTTGGKQITSKEIGVTEVTISVGQALPITGDIDNIRDISTNSSRKLQELESAAIGIVHQKEVTFILMRQGSITLKLVLNSNNG